jgi:hypothetical protein
MLLAFADESDAGQIQKGVFTVSGYCAFQSQWATFVDAWASVLDGDPAFRQVGYFKSSALHSHKWRKQYSITKGDANRVHAKLVSVIQTQPILFSVIATLRCEDWNRIIRQGVVGEAEWVNNPYYFCYHAFCAITLRHVHALGIVGDQVDFIFDNKDAISDRANELFRWIREAPELHPTIKNLMGLAESGLDTALPPLQAADILASRVMHYCMKPVSRRRSESLQAISWSGDRNITVHLPPSHFEKFMTGFSEH